METIDRLKTHILTASDFGGAMALVAEAGWNQTVEDWRLMCGPGGAVGVDGDDGTLVATALAWPYSPDFGYVSMVLVAGAYRRRGLATALLRGRIEWLRDRGMVPTLDATELGEPVYNRLGFKAGLRFTRWQGRGGLDVPGIRRARPAEPADRSWIMALDRAAFGAERAFMLDDFLGRPGSRCWVSDVPGAGFVIARAGRRAAQIGPLSAVDEATAAALLETVLAETEGPVFFDALDTRTALGDVIREAGLTRQRGFVRMRLGEVPDFDGNGRMMIIAGPEYG